MSIKVKTLLRLFLGLIFFLFVLNLSRNIWRILHAGERLEKAQEKLGELKAENAQLRQEKDRLKSNDFLEEQARNKLFMAKKNEIVLILPIPSVYKEEGFFEEEEIVDKEEGEIWQKWLALFW